MSEEAIKAEVRLYAVEWLATIATAIVLKNSGHGIDYLEEIKTQTLAGALTKTFAGVNPAMSDHLSVELHDALDRLLKMAKSHLKTGE